MLGSALPGNNHCIDSVHVLQALAGWRSLATAGGSPECGPQPTGSCWVLSVPCTDSAG